MIPKYSQVNFKIVYEKLQFSYHSARTKIRSSQLRSNNLATVIPDLSVDYQQLKGGLGD